MAITERIQIVRERILRAAINYQRRPEDIKLLAVSKGHTRQAIEQAYSMGLQDFGESYLQEAIPKINALAHLPLCWHFIGPIQSNKASKIAHYFSWVQSLSRPNIAQLLNDNRPELLPRLNVCLQINFDQEETKAGVNPESATEIASYVMQLPRLHLCGLMSIPKKEADPEQQYHSFLRLKELLYTLNRRLNTNMNVLSMGMSNDLEAAIRAGSTLVRIGTAIFGERSN